MQDDAKENAVIAESENTLASVRNPCKPATIRHIAFIAIIAFLCFAAIGNYSLSKIAPSIFSTEVELASKYAKTASLDDILANPLASMANGDLSGFLNFEIERVLCNAYPSHDNFLLAHAALQRQGISTSDLLDQYGVLPTFYGSTYAYMPSKQIVFPQLTAMTDEQRADAAEHLDSYVSLVENNPNIKWCFYVADVYAASKANPTHGLTSNYVDYDDFYGWLAEAVPETTEVIYAGYDGLDSLTQDRFRTDHHWNIDGAIKGFQAIANALGIDSSVSGQKEVASTSEFQGSGARIGLMLDYPDVGVEDVVTDTSTLSATLDGKSVDISELYCLCGENGAPYKAPSGSSYDLYGECYHSLRELVIENSAVEEGTLLIIGDSFSWCLERYFTTSFHTVINIDPRYEGLSIQDFIDKYSPDTVVSIQNCNGFYGLSNQTAARTGE